LLNLFAISGISPLTLSICDLVFGFYRLIPQPYIDVDYAISTPASASREGTLSPIPAPPPVIIAAFPCSSILETPKIFIKHKIYVARRENEAVRNR
jgi:hypothetical protein